MPRQTLVERKDGRFLCRFDDKCFYGKTQEEALRKRDKYLIDCGIGYDPDLSEVPFLDYGLAWLGAYRSECNSMQRRMYENMITSAAGILKKKYLRMINATDIQCLFNTLKGKSQSYISKYCTTIRSIFRAAIQDGIIVRSPAEMAKPPKGTAAQHRYLEPWEQKLVMDTWQEHDFGPAAMTMMFAGLRRGEALYLDIDRDIDFEKKQISVQGALSFTEDIRGNITAGKTKAAIRTIPLNTCLEQVLKGRHGLLLPMSDGSLMTLSAFDRKYESYINFLETKVNGCHKRWYGKAKEHKQILKEGGELPPWKDIKIRCHDFRVSFCTMCYEAGIPIKTLQSWMGHSDAKMIMEVYAKLSAEKEQFDASRLDEFMQKRYNL